MDNLQIPSLNFVSVTAFPLCPQVLYEFNVTLTIENEQCPQFSKQQQYLDDSES